jgi:hypothetical protein
MANRKVTAAKKTVFALRGRVSVGGVKPHEIGSELTRIYEENGSITTKLVVDAARPDVAPLHPAFEWNDNKAGEAYREYQARNIIRMVEIIKTDDVGEARKVQAYAHIPSQTKERAGSYEPISIIVNHPDKFVMALSALQARVDSAKNALDDLKAAADESTISENRMTSLTIAAMAMQTARDAVLRIQ